MFESYGHLSEDYAKHINPELIKMLSILGYGRFFIKAKDVWVWDALP